MDSHRNPTRRTPLLIALALALLVPFPVGARVAEPAVSGRAGDSARELTIDARVEYQTRIEAVYWRHTVWPAENGRPKPALAAVMSQSVILARVTDALAKSSALENLYRRPITADLLQAEMDRVASNTRQPEVLRDLWAALDNDPYLVAECLARPVLADRLLRSWYASDDRYHAESRDRAESALRANGVVEKSPDARYVETELTNSASGSGDALEAEAASLTVGATSELLETDQQFYTVTVLERTGDTTRVAIASWPKMAFETWWTDAARSLPAVTPIARTHYTLPATDRVRIDDQWTRPSFMPRPRDGHTAVWTGTRMIVWGGILQYPETGAIYNPATDLWHPLNTVKEPTPRSVHKAFWTGTEMIVWGGWGGLSANNLLNTGGRYNPLTDTWTPTSTGPNVPAPRDNSTAVWTGTEMMVWGGSGIGGEQLGDGARYDPASDTWTPMTMTNAPAPRAGATAVWTGTRMVVWGGVGGSVYLNSGGSYDPATNSWTAMETAGAPAGRTLHTAIWSGSVVIVWGGVSNLSPPFNSGGRYDPVANTWAPTSLAGAPSATYRHSAVWTGTSMIVWGGCASHSCSYQFNTGGRYDPQTDTWTPTSTVNAPSPRASHVAVWTGTEMIVWGGWFNSNVVNTGGRYDPVTDTWVPTAMSPVPWQRTLPSAVWTGTEMVDWGVDSELLDKSVYRYLPATDLWTRLFSLNAADARSGHSVVWTGTEMIVWGGGVTGFGVSLTGGRFNPFTNTWTETSVTGAPSARVWHSAVWTGSEMIVWGGCLDEGCDIRLDTGGRYNPVSDTWTPISAAGAPGARSSHTATWTGSEMIVWGGRPLSSAGGRYDPSSDSWTTVSSAGAPSARFAHSAIWTGSEMILWGGFDGTSIAQGGARYDPAANAWQPVSGTGAPSARWNHTAVWTGSEMIVWGGIGNNTWPYEAVQTGGRYRPATDGWTEVSIQCAPSGRDAHRAVWTGTQMIVWGGFMDPSGVATNTGGVYTAGTFGAGDDTPGIDVAGTCAWFLRNTSSSGSADHVFEYGPSGSAWMPFAGDWDGNGTDTPGLYDPATGFFFLKNSVSAGPADLMFGFGPGGAGWRPIAGDWDGNGIVTVGLYDPATGAFYLRNSNTPGAADLTFGYGPAGSGWAPLAGDWDGNGTDTVGLYDPATGTFFLRNANAPGAADLTFGYGPGSAGWTPIVGDWDGNGADSIGLYDPASGFFFLKLQLSSGPADLTFGFGAPGATALAGNWDGL